LIVELKENAFNLRIENNVTDFLSCLVIEDEKRDLSLQPHLVNNLQAKFGNEVEKERAYKTPGTPRFRIVCHSDDDDTIDAVGMLLYLKKFSQPDLCNVVRELSKCMAKATMGTYLEMLHVIKFVIGTKYSVTEFNPKL
jgi:hypothetical protein